MHHVMFDIDGTLIESYDFDSECFAEAVNAVTGVEIDTHWARYENVTDVGILNQFLFENHLQNTGSVIQNVKQEFLNKIKNRIAKRPVNQIPGASAFIDRLKALDGVVISFATGGWYESAVLKLQSAGIDFSGIPIASSNDHYSRVEIMKLADRKATGDVNLRFTYFGDGSWDWKACEELGVNFVLVGDKLECDQSIKNFGFQKEALAFIGLLRRLK